MDLVVQHAVVVLGELAVLLGLVGGLVGVALAFLTPYMVRPVPDVVWLPAAWTPEVAWHRILGPIASVLAIWLGYAIVVVSLRMSRIAAKLERIDLLDLSPLAPFTQQGLTHSLLGIGAMSIFGLVMLETGFGLVMLIMGGGILLLCVFALITPLRGVHRRIKLAKETEIQWANREISGHTSELRSQGTAGRSGDLADLVAYRSLVENVPDWPFTGSTYARLVVYALIPIVSWSLGIAVEQFVERVLLQ